MAQRTPRRYDEDTRSSGADREMKRSSGSGRQARDDSRRYYDADRERDYRRAPQKKRKKKGTAGLVVLLIVLILLAGGVFFVLQSGILKQGDDGVIEVQKPLPAAPKVVRTATLGSTGDIILHLPILYAHETEDDYDFTYVFSNVADIYGQTDLMVANLEVTLGGPESGEYRGYPGFNSPDAIVPALKNAGVDICLTANNHSNDTGYYGMMRTLDVLDSYGVEHLGSRESTDEHYLMTKNINGIRLGMLCYTYDTREYTDGEKSLNFNYLSDEAVGKIATFNYEYLDEFYAEVQQQLDYMDMLNVDAKIIYMHWGTEYMDEPDYYQTEIAQRLCDMGFDVIIGSHPHVIQMFDTLTAADGHETICLYSMGNQLSNQRKEEMDPEEPRGYTEDGLVIQVTFEKFNNGNVKVGAVDIVPTWVELDGNGYQIIALDETDPWSWGAGDTYSAIDSYNRTLGRLGSAYTSYRARKGQSEVLTWME